MESVDLEGDQQHGTASAHAGDVNGNDAAQAESPAADTAEQNIHNGASAAAPDAGSPQHAAEASTSDMHNGDTFSVHLGRPSYTQIEVHPSETAGVRCHTQCSVFQRFFSVSCLRLFEPNQFACHAHQSQCFCLSARLDSDTLLCTCTRTSDTLDHLQAVQISTASQPPHPVATAPAQGGVSMTS